MITLYCLLLGILGLCVGSFVAALTYRLPRGISIVRGRSKCPNCDKTITWHDNIPLFSYIFLKGKCRSCKKKISPRYFLIELSFLILFPLTYYFLPFIISNSFFLTRTDLVTTFFFVIFSLASVIFVIDLEHQIIPDSLNFVLLLLVLMGLFLSSNTIIFIYLLSGLIASLFLLLIHLATKGMGMGLGDVKLALPVGILLGYPLVVVWLIGSFILGALIGVFLILIGKAKLGRHIAFGPFLVISLLITLLFGNIIWGTLF